MLNSYQNNSTINGILKPNSQQKSIDVKIKRNLKLKYKLKKINSESNSNNNNSNSQMNITSDETSDVIQTNSTALISDEEDDNLSNTSLESGCNSNQSGFLNQLKEYFASNNSSCNRKCTGMSTKCQGILSKSVNFSTLLAILTCGVAKTIVIYTLYFTIWFIMKLICFLKVFTGVKQVWKIPFAMPKAILVRLLCFCGMSKCRCINVRSFLTIKRKPPIDKKDQIFTICSWPLWILGGSIIITTMLTCQFSGPNTTFQQKFKMAKITLLWLNEYLYFNMYFLPGYECMVLDNCCMTPWISVKRWFYCFSSMPYRTVFFGMHVETIDVEFIEESLSNITDWKLRRIIRKMGHMKDDLKRRVLVVNHRMFQFKRGVAQLSLEVSKNLTFTNALHFLQEKVDRQFDDAMKYFDVLNSQLFQLHQLKILFKKHGEENLECIKAGTKAAVKESDTLYLIEHKKVKKMIASMNKIEKEAHLRAASVDFENTIKAFRRKLHKFHITSITLQAKVTQYEAFRFKFKSEIQLLQHYVLNKLAASVFHQHQLNERLMGRIDKRFDSFCKQIQFNFRDHRPSLQESLREQMVKALVRIRRRIMKAFCPKIAEFVKLAVLSSITLAGTIKSCGVASDPDTLCVENLIEDMEHGHQPFCFNNSYIQSQIKMSLEIHYSDDIGIMDYALVHNGAELLESLTSNNTLHVNVYQDNRELTETSFQLWNTLIHNTHNIINSVRYMNRGKLQSGYCWNFIGNNGSTVIKLAKPIKILLITVEHIPISIALANNISNSPKNIEFVMLSETLKEQKSLGSFIFDEVDKFPLQQFSIENNDTVSFLKVNILSNHGADVTCVYRIRVHGKS